MHYRFLHQIPGESAEMAVGFIAMVGTRWRAELFFQEIPTGRTPTKS